MNDPGLDEPIGNVQRQEIKDNESSCEQDAADEDEQAYLEPAQVFQTLIWWFASTAFPLIAGTFGPMASAFSICALAIHWREDIPQGIAEKDGIDIPDPHWLIAVNGVQLAIALIANLFLLMNMARRVRFSIGMPVTIVGWYVSSITLTILCILARQPSILEPRGNDHFSQAYYYAVFSAGLYFMVASLLLITVWGAHKGHYEKDFQLTIPQRTLMLQTISFLIYLLGGAGVFARVEKWKYLDAVYFADYTLLTVGIGNITPTTHAGRSILFPYAIGGIMILGLVIGSIRSLVLDRGKVKMANRMVEKERRRMIRKLENKSKDAVLNPVKEGERSLSRSSTATVDYRSESLTERQRRHQEFKLMRKIQSAAEHRRRWTSLLVSGTTWMALWFVGAAIFRRCERSQDWSYFVSMYFAYTSLLTIGYGDYYPTSNSGKAFFVFWSLLAIPSLTILISNMGDTIIRVIRDITLRIGDLTLLPGEKGVKANLKELASQITRGRLFDTNAKETPPGILGEGQPRSSEEFGNHHPKNDPESARQALDDDLRVIEKKSAHERGKNNDELPKSKHHFHLLLAKEISTVMRHLNSSPPVQYTFEEWAWYLKLVGEDEGNSDHHRKPVRSGKVLKEEAFGTLNGEGNGGSAGEGMNSDDSEGGGERANGVPRNAEVNGGEEEKERKKAKWSWVGNRSPLMATTEEAEWVLQRLMKRLERELEAIRKEELERMGPEDEKSSQEGEWNGTNSGRK